MSPRISQRLRFQRSALGNYADQKNYQPSSQSEKANPVKPSCGSPRDHPRKNAEYTTDSQKSDNLFVWLHNNCARSVWSTSWISDPTPLTSGLKPRRNREVHCIRLGVVNTHDSAWCCNLREVRWCNLSSTDYPNQ